MTAVCIKCHVPFDVTVTEHGKATVRCPSCRAKRAERQRLLRAGEVEPEHGGFAPVTPTCPECGDSDIGNCQCVWNMTSGEIELSYKRRFAYASLNNTKRR